MKLLEDRILKDGVVLSGGVLKVDGFLNHRLDVPFFDELAKEFYRLFGNSDVNKILTVEASGIGLACITALRFGCPVVFAKKSRTKNVTGGIYTAPVFSFTHGEPYEIMVSEAYLGPSDRVLIIDDFLAMGEALRGLRKICEDAGAYVVGAGIAIEKAFQPGGKSLRESGLRVESLARIESMDPEKGITFCR